MTLLDGKKVSNEIIEKVKQEIKNKNLELGFAIIWAGNDESSGIYVKNKIRKCQYAGIKTELYHLNDNTAENEIINLINKLNERKDINGILLQSPVPEHIDITKCFNAIIPEKDIDGLSDTGYKQKHYHIPCTAKGIIRLLDYYNIELCDKKICIINRSKIVGLPLSNLLRDRKAIVTICHSKTENIDDIVKNADIVISGVGKPNFITENMIKENTVVIDVGITRCNGNIVGDVDFEKVSKKASFITPVPGGVGPMTIAMVLENILETAK